MEQPVSAVLDANILFSAPLRDLLIRLADAGLMQAKWTDVIHEEWIRNVLKYNPQISPGQLDRTRNLMNSAVSDCLVTGFEGLMDSILLPDPDDRHILAAAIHSGSEVIVTYNLRDFPEDIMTRFNIEAMHPDDFLVHLFDLAPGIFCSVVERQRMSLRCPPKTLEELLRTFEAQGVIQTVARLRRFLTRLP